jgi:hypothetical protein
MTSSQLVRILFIFLFHIDNLMLNIIRLKLENILIIVANTTDLCKQWSTDAAHIG